MQDQKAQDNSPGVEAVVDEDTARILQQKCERKTLNKDWNSLIFWPFVWHLIKHIRR